MPENTVDKILQVLALGVHNLGGSSQMVTNGSEPKKGVGVGSISAAGSSFAPSALCSLSTFSSVSAIAAHRWRTECTPRQWNVRTCFAAQMCFSRIAKPHEITAKPHRPPP